MSISSSDCFSLSSGLGNLSLAPKRGSDVLPGYDELKRIEDLTEAAISHSKSLRNINTSFLTRFPHEIIALIISHLQPELPDHNPFTPPETKHEWLRASHVCRHWRTAALTTPSLWDRVYLGDDNPEPALECLRRSGVVPFTLHFYGTIPGDELEEQDESLYEVLEQIFLEAPRLRHLHINSTWTRNSLFWDLFYHPAPLLESLAIAMADGQDTEASFLSQVFNDDMPRLKNLYLSNVSSWPYNQFRNLVRLRLFNQFQFSRPHLTTFLQTLQASSSTLEELVAVRAGPTHYILEMGEEIFKNVPRVRLPALRYIQIGDTNQEDSTYLRRFFSFIVIPPMAKCCFHEHHNQGLTPSQYFPRVDDDSEDIRQPVIHKLSLTSFPATLNSKSFVGRSGSTFYANANWESPSFIVDPHFLKSVEELVYSPSWHWHYSFDPRVLSNLPALRTLKLHGDFFLRLRRIWDVLEERTDPNDSQAPMKHVPLLENIHIYSTNTLGTGRFGEQQQEMDGLIKVLDLRRRCGSPIKSVVVHRFPKEQTDRLQGRPEDLILLDSSDEDETGVTEEDILSEFWEGTEMARPDFM